MGLLAWDDEQEQVKGVGGEEGDETRRTKEGLRMEASESEGERGGEGEQGDEKERGAWWERELER